MTTKTIKTHDGEITVDVEATKEAHGRLWADLGATGLDGITASSCIANGGDTAMEQGVAAEDRDLAAMYYAVGTASFYELKGF